MERSHASSIRLSSLFDGREMAQTKHEDTTVNLDMPFDEAIRRLAQPKRKGSQAEKSGSTKSDGDRSPERPKRRTAPRPKSSGD